MNLLPVSLDSLRSNHNLLQDGFWGRFKAGGGMRPYAFLLDSQPLLCMYRSLPGGCGFLYIPHGPDISVSKGDRAGFLEELGRNLAVLVKQPVLFVRYDPLWPLTDDEQRETVYPLPLRKAAVDVQMPDTVVLDISPTEDGILGNMKAKTRYNIRLAEKKGVGVRADNTAVAQWYDLYKVTAARDGIAIHDLGYYQKLLEMSAECGSSGSGIVLLLAEYQGIVLAGIIVAFQGNTATYLYGASSNEHRNLMPAYLLQWEAIRAAKGRGCTRYDFFGIPPCDDAGHPSHGLYRFKTGFGGEIIHRAGSWDLPIRPAGYYLYTRAERLRLWYYKTLKKRLAGR